MDVKRGLGSATTTSAPGTKDIPRNKSPCEITHVDTPSFSFSSDRFVFNEVPDEEETVDCINKSGHLFAEFKKKPSTLEEALKSMEYDNEKAKKLSGMFLERGDEKLKK